MWLFGRLPSGLRPSIHTHGEFAFGVVVNTFLTLVLVFQNLRDVVVAVVRLVLFRVDDVLREAVQVCFRSLVHVLEGRWRVYDLVDDLLRVFFLLWGLLHIFWLILFHILSKLLILLLVLNEFCLLDVVLLHEILVYVHVRVVYLLACLANLLWSRKGCFGVARSGLSEEADVRIFFLYSAPNILRDVSQLVLRKLALVAQFLQVLAQLLRLHFHFSEWNCALKIDIKYTKLHRARVSETETGAR